MAIKFFDSENNIFDVILDRTRSFEPPHYDTCQINRDGSGNIYQINYIQASSVVYTLFISQPNATHTVINDTKKSLTITTNESNQVTGLAWS